MIMGVFADKRVGFKITVSAELVDFLSQEKLDEMLNAQVSHTKSLFLERYSDYEPMGECSLVCKCHPTREEHEALIVETDKWDFVYELELRKL